ncbi:hypothetical protein OESDEN_01342 [Oesophagostomum dentatum]|uniref:Uncharacterized protein n=1 Tax=Oesophagostomum dentatum TaxID=61180 RepID=A0A0B1TMC8_OESDE|nr:hypothetical protein OESDEN_01342 [Oesophagostomum dentatum]
MKEWNCKKVPEDAEKNLKLAVIKRHWSDAEYERVDEAIRDEFARAHEENRQAAQKVSRLPADEWKNDRMDQLRKWQTIPPINYAPFTLGNDIKNALETFLDSTVQFSVNDSSEVPLSTKPPVLHWTPLPLDSELQVLIRISFPLAGPDNCTFTDIRKSIRKHFDNIYEWTEGILITDDPIHLHVERTSPTEIEIAARVCVEELEEEQQSNPAKLLWPYIALALRNTLSHLDEHQYLQYSVSVKGVLLSTGN